jgi:signal transduction histidine kinase
MPNTDPAARRSGRLGLAVAAATCLLIIAAMAPANLAAQEARPRSILVIDDANAKAPFYYEVYSRLRAIVNARANAPVSLYTESLDLTRFRGADYEQSLRQLLQAKYRDRPIGLIVTIGSSALEQVLGWRPTLWPSIPVVFGLVDEPTVARLNLPSDVTGFFIKLRFADMMSVARAVVTDLGAVALVGDPLENQTLYRHFKDEIPAATTGVEVIDLTGLKMREVRARVATLPERTAILYTGIYSDGEGTNYVPAVALSLVAGSANRPIVVTSENEIGLGAVGGYVIAPARVGDSIAGLAMRVLDGESASSIPIRDGNVVRPIFDWRQMQRWGVSASALPLGSEIRFRDLTAWELYRTQILGTIALVLAQMALIAWLMFERQRRRLAEASVRSISAELAQMDRIAAANQLSASIAHEIKQPLTGIVLRASAALRWLAGDKPDIDRARDSISGIVDAGHHANEVVDGLRAMFRKDTNEKVHVDINKLIGTVLAIARPTMINNDVELQTRLDEGLPVLKGDEVQLQQVVLNLIMNGIESMQSTRPRVLSVKSASGKPGFVRVSVEDTGSGVDPFHLDKIFKPLFTTKARGMGMGLSICQSIVEAHDGQIWVSQGSNSGSIFQFELPADPSEM